MSINCSLPLSRCNMMRSAARTLGPESVSLPCSLHQSRKLISPTLYCKAMGLLWQIHLRNYTPIPDCGCRRSCLDHRNDGHTVRILARLSFAAQCAESHLHRGLFESKSAAAGWPGCPPKITTGRKTYSAVLDSMVSLDPSLSESSSSRKRRTFLNRLAAQTCNESRRLTCIFKFYTFTCSILSGRVL